MSKIEGNSPCIIYIFPYLVNMVTEQLAFLILAAICIIAGVILQKSNKPGRFYNRLYFIGGVLIIFFLYSYFFS